MLLTNTMSQFRKKERKKEGKIFTWNEAIFFFFQFKKIFSDFFQVMAKLHFLNSCKVINLECISSPASDKNKDYSSRAFNLRVVFVCKKINVFSKNINMAIRMYSRAFIWVYRLTFLIWFKYKSSLVMKNIVLSSLWTRKTTIPRHYNPHNVNWRCICSSQTHFRKYKIKYQRLWNCTTLEMN